MRSTDFSQTQLLDWQGSQCCTDARELLSALESTQADLEEIPSACEFSGLDAESALNSPSRECSILRQSIHAYDQKLRFPSNYCRRLLLHKDLAAKKAKDANVVAMGVGKGCPGFHRNGVLPYCGMPGRGRPTIINV